jgi:hypothetical protein
MQNIKLPYGLREGKIVHISEVEQGLQCECICPACKERLIARKGEQRIDHFAHYNKGNCQEGLESGLHLAAKKILESCQSIVLPPIMIDFGYSEPTWFENGGTGQCLKPIMLCAEKKYSISNILVEQKIKDIIPDILVYINNSIVVF